MRLPGRHRMANIHSQKKRILRSERERLENRNYTSAVKTYFRNLESAVDGGETERADAEHKRLVRESLPELTAELQHVFGLVQGMQHHAPEDQWPDRVKSELEGGNDTEVSPTAP